MIFGCTRVGYHSPVIDPFVIGVIVALPVIMLGGVQVQVAGPISVLPTPPDVEHPEVLWPTSRMAMYTSVLMTDGTRWTVYPVPRYTQAGDVALTLRALVPSRVTLILTVPRDHLGTEIWWVGEVPPARPGGQPTEEQDDSPPSLPPVVLERGIWTP